MKTCPKCGQKAITKAGLVGGKQRYKCKPCSYHFTVEKDGKAIRSQIVKRALQLYIEGLSYREIEIILRVSHVTVMNWVKKYNISRPDTSDSSTGYSIMNHEKVQDLISNDVYLGQNDVLISKIKDQYMVLSFENESV